MELKMQEAYSEVYEITMNMHKDYEELAEKYNLFKDRKINTVVQMV